MVLLLRAGADFDLGKTLLMFSFFRDMRKIFLPRTYPECVSDAFFSREPVPGMHLLLEDSKDLYERPKLAEHEGRFGGTTWLETFQVFK